jgi:hypothetical protein
VSVAQISLSGSKLALGDTFIALGSAHSRQQTLRSGLASALTGGPTVSQMEWPLFFLIYGVGLPYLPFSTLQGQGMLASLKNC